MYAQQPPKNPTLAAILSFIIAGVGQIYNGEVVKGIIIIVVQILNVALMGIVIGFITWPIVWIWSIYDAHKVAKRINEEAAQQVVETTKVCPRCAERVNTGAQVCRFCNYQFMPEDAALTAPPVPVMGPAAIAAPVAVAVPVAVAESQTAAAQSKACPQCGSPSQADARFCMSCGYSYEAPLAEAVAEPLDGVEMSFNGPLAD